MQTLREALPAVAFLVTSRILLQLPSEREFPVAPLPTPLQNLGAAQVGQCASAALFCDRAGLSLDEGRGWIETFLRATQNRETATPEQARALSGAGRLAWYASDMEGANARLEAELRAAKAAGDQSTLIYATRTLARVAGVGGEVERALELGRESVDLARAAGESAALLESLMDLAFAEFNAGDFAGAEREARESLALARQAGDDSKLALALTLMACVCEIQNRLDEALAWVAESEALCRRLGVQWELMVCLGMQGQLWSKRGDFVHSQNCYNQALTICRGPLLSTWHAVTTLFSVSGAWMRRGDARIGKSAVGRSGV